jgi:hypothetical protein
VLSKEKKSPNHDVSSHSYRRPDRNSQAPAREHVKEHNTVSKHVSDLFICQIAISISLYVPLLPIEN